MHVISREKDYSWYPLIQYVIDLYYLSHRYQIRKDTSASTKSVNENTMKCKCEGIRITGATSRL